MDRNELDAFFARADDVLDDWHGSRDAMNTAAPVHVQPEAPRWAPRFTMEIQGADGEWRPVEGLVYTPVINV